MATRPVSRVKHKTSNGKGVRKGGKVGTKKVGGRRR